MLPDVNPPAMRAALITALATLLAIASPVSAHASGGKRQVAQQKAPAKKATRGKKPAKKSAGASKKAPRKPGSEAAAPDKALRESVAGQPVTEDVAAGAGAPELREVDDVLFPEVASADLAGTGDALADTRVVASGLPVLTEPQVETDAPSDLKWMASLVKPDIPFRWDARLVKYLDYFKNNPKGRSFAAALVKRSGRFEAKIRAAAKAKGLPEDLVWVALVESGMNPRIASGAGAAGLWQFMPKAATAYGLRIDRWVDERLDPERSTAAALRFLQDLHARFGSWELALAAYNMGHGALLSAVRKYNTNDFWELSQLEAGVPYETSLYVPKIVALAFVARNKQVFGCEGIEPDPPEPFEAAAPASSAAAPARKKDDAVILTKAAHAPPISIASTPVKAAGLVSYKLRWGESLEHVALATGTTESKIRALNGITSTVPPRPGTELLLPSKPADVDPLEEAVAVVPGRSPVYPGKRRVFYEVVWGDRIDAVARELGVTVEELCRWNNVDRDARLHGKMILQAFVDDKRELPDVRLVAADKAKVLVVGSPEFFEHFEAKNGRTRVVHTAKEGETLVKLAKRYGCSAGLLERINHRPRKASLGAGERVVVYTSRVETAKAAPTSDLYDEASAPKEDLGG